MRGSGLATKRLLIAATAEAFSQAGCASYSGSLCQRGAVVDGDDDAHGRAAAGAPVDAIMEQPTC